MQPEIQQDLHVPGMLQAEFWPSALHGHELGAGSQIAEREALMRHRFQEEVLFYCSAVPQLTVWDNHLNSAWYEELPSDSLECGPRGKKKGCKFLSCSVVAPAAPGFRFQRRQVRGRGAGGAHIHGGLEPPLA